MTVIEFNKAINNIEGHTYHQINGIIKICKKNWTNLNQEHRQIIEDKLKQCIRVAQHDIESCLDNNFFSRDLDSEKYVFTQSKAVWKAICFIIQQLPLLYNH